MCYIIEPPEIKEKQEKVKPYLIGALKFKDGTPEYIKTMYQEILDFYKQELDGLQ